jgi:hypothetical protein
MYKLLEEMKIKIDNLKEKKYFMEKLYEI